MTAHELYQADPQAANDLYTAGYLAGERHRDLEATPFSFWGAFWFGLVVGIVIMIVGTVL